MILAQWWQCLSLPYLGHGTEYLALYKLQVGCISGIWVNGFQGFQVASLSSSQVLTISLFSDHASVAWLLGIPLKGISQI